MMRWTMVLCFCCLLTACAGGHWTEHSGGTKWVYKIDADGKKHLVYVERGDRLTIHDPDDPKAKEAQAEHQRRHGTREREADRIARIRKAPKRGPNDPIRVALLETKLGPKLAKGQSSAGAVGREIRKNFQNDPILKLADLSNREKNESLKKKGFNLDFLHRRSNDADVDVETKVYFKEVVGINKTTKKIGKGVVLIYEATIRNNYLPETFTVKESGGILENVAATKRFCDKIKTAIKNNVGPTIPKDRSQF